MDKKFSLEVVYQIWNDKHGSRIEVGPDSDGLGLFEIRYYSDDGVKGSIITFDREQGTLIAEAIRKATEMV